MLFGCEETRRYVDAWIDGELDPGASLHVETHIARCDACREEANMIRSLKHAMSALRESDHAPASLRARLSALLDAEDAAEHQAASQAKRRKHAAGFVIAGAALAGFVLATGRHDGASPDVQVSGAGLFPAVLEDITQRHARELPLEVSGAHPEQVANFFRNRLDIPVRPVAFRGVPANLLGARISNVRDRMAAALYYDVGGRRVTVFVFDSSLLPRSSYGLVHRTVGNQNLYVGEAHGYTVTIAERGGVAYALTTDLPPQDAVRIAASAELQ